MHRSMKEDIERPKVTMSNFQMFQPMKNTDKLLNLARDDFGVNRSLSDDVVVNTVRCTFQKDIFRTVEVTEDYVLMPFPILYEEVEYFAFFRDAFSAVVFHLFVCRKWIIKEVDRLDHN